MNSTREFKESNSSSKKIELRKKRAFKFLALGGALLFLLGSYLLCADQSASARVGGGHSFHSSGGHSSSPSSSSSSHSSPSSSSSSSSSSSGSSPHSSSSSGSRFTPGAIIAISVVGVVGIIIIVGLVVVAARRKRAAPSFTTADDNGVAARLEELRRSDPNFSEILFSDFIYTLYARVQKARGEHSLEQFASYLAPDVIQSLQSMSEPDLKEVQGIIIGSSRIESVSDPAQDSITITVQFETNYTEVKAAPGADDSANTWYAREMWSFTRRRDLLSRPPEKIGALHCPSCGGGLEKNADGSCAYCGVKIAGGDFDWFVTEMQVLERVAQGPLLTSDVEEEGTDLPTVMQPDFESRRQQFETQNPDFTWQETEARMRHIFMEAQQAWTTLQWERVRPFEADNIFQMHQFWINEYRRQQLRNVLENIQLAQVVPVRISADAFYDSITVRIYASMIDYTVNAQGQRVCGNPRAPRPFTEYWTFMRRRGVKANDKSNEQCPNCGAALNINMAGVCEFCGGKVTSGEFDWVLSRIEQDETYHG